MTDFRCTKCMRGYPEEGIPFRCVYCGGLFDLSRDIEFNPDLEEYEFPGIWRYRYTFNLPEDAPIVYLGEGNTPLVWGQAFQRDIAFKLESLNPTGSFKDRGSAVLVSFLKSKFVYKAVEDSSGNAGSSFAAYAIRAGIKARIYIPDYASGPKQNQIGAYGAEIINIRGPRSAAAEAVLLAAKQGEAYASHAHLPMGITGFATTAYEIVDQVKTTPGTVVTPVGQGNMLIGLIRGFVALKKAGVVKHIPKFVGVQAQACAPFWTASRYGISSLANIAEGDTIAEGVRIRKPFRLEILLELMRENMGIFVAVDEHEILPGRDHLSKLGFYVEPTSAIIWNALSQIADSAKDPIVVILTGMGLKSN